ncbi:MAG: hypothetical protein ACKO2P_14710 [Planctomycetota bacterium]
MNARLVCRCGGVLRVTFRRHLQNNSFKCPDCESQLLSLFTAPDKSKQKVKEKGFSCPDCGARVKAADMLCSKCLSNFTAGYAQPVNPASHAGPNAPNEPAAKLGPGLAALEVHRISTLRFPEQVAAFLFHALVILVMSVIRPPWALPSPESQTLSVYDAAVLCSFATVMLAQFSVRDIVRLLPPSRTSSDVGEASGQRQLLGSPLASWSASLSEYHAVRMYEVSSFSLSNSRILPVLLLVLISGLFPVMFLILLLTAPAFLARSIFGSPLYEVYIAGPLDSPIVIGRHLPRHAAEFLGTVASVVIGRRFSGT